MPESGEKENLLRGEEHNQCSEVQGVRDCCRRRARLMAKERCDVFWEKRRESLWAEEKSKSLGVGYL